MKVQFWGVRGSISAPGPHTNRYGGNTACVSIVDASGHLCVLDMGTGIVPLGQAILSGALPLSADFGAGEGRASVLLSHGHWDHIQGFPFFAPIFIPGNHFEIFGDAQAGRIESILEGQMNPQYSPIYTLKNMGAEIEFKALSPGQGCRASNLEIQGHQNPHGETTSLAFRIEEAGRSVVYASDVGYPESGPSDATIEFYRGADLLIHDSTYTPEEQIKLRSRGLSSYLEAADVALRAGVKKLALFHYDQDHEDDLVDELVKGCAQELDRIGGGQIEVIGAREGLEISLS